MPKKYNGPSVRQGRTHTGKLPDSFGCCSRTGGGFVRKLTKKEEEQQRKFTNS